MAGSVRTAPARCRPPSHRAKFARRSALSVIGVPPNSGDAHMEGHAGARVLFLKNNRPHDCPRSASAPKRPCCCLSRAAWLNSPSSSSAGMSVSWRKCFIGREGKRWMGAKVSNFEKHGAKWRARLRGRRAWPSQRGQQADGYRCRWSACVAGLASRKCRPPRAWGSVESCNPIMKPCPRIFWSASVELPKPVRP